MPCCNCVLKANFWLKHMFLAWCVPMETPRHYTSFWKAKTARKSLSVYSANFCTTMDNWSVLKKAMRLSTIRGTDSHKLINIRLACSQTSTCSGQQLRLNYCVRSIIERTTNKPGYNDTESGTRAWIYRGSIWDELLSGLKPKLKP